MSWIRQGRELTATSVPSTSGCCPPRGPATLVMVDLDDFKTTNDRYGHVVGDVVLIRVATALEGPLARTTCWSASAVTSS